MLRRRRKTATVPHAGPYPHGWEVPARFNFTRDVVEPLGRTRAALRSRSSTARASSTRSRTFAEVAGRRRPLGAACSAPGSTGRPRARAHRQDADWHARDARGAEGAAPISIPCSDMLRGQGSRVPRPPLGRAAARGRRPVVRGRGRGDAEQSRGAGRRALPRRGAGGAGSGRDPIAPTADTAAGDPALILYTSGTTKEPEGRRPHARLHLGEARAGRALAGRRPGRPRLVHGGHRAGRSRSGTCCSARGACGAGGRPPRGRRSTPGSDSG